MVSILEKSSGNKPLNLGIKILEKVFFWINRRSSDLNLLRTIYILYLGFRFVTSKYNVRSLTSVRCSVLVNRVVNKENCTLLTFDKQPFNESKIKYNTKWQHECPEGYGLVGLYDETEFKKIEKAKCCSIEGESCGYERNYCSFHGCLFAG